MVGIVASRCVCGERAQQPEVDGLSERILGDPSGLENRSAAEDVAERLEEFGSRVELVHADLSNASSTSDLCDFVSGRRIDVLVNNGGAVTQPCGWRDITIEAASSSRCTR